MAKDGNIQGAMSALAGLPLWALGRAADLAWFEFGERRTVRTHLGNEKQVGDYALHIQCPWRITRGDKIITGRGDIFCTPEESDLPTPEDFDWQTGNRFDRIVVELFEQKSGQFTVHSVQVGEAGSLAIVLDDAISSKCSLTTPRAASTGGSSSHIPTSRPLCLVAPA
jgi:hypothetical protein